MKTFSTILMTGLLVWLATGQPARAEEDYVFRSVTDRSDIIITDGSAYITDGEMISEPGVPAIGYKVEKVVLPADTRIVDISINAGRAQTIYTGNIDFIRGDLKTGDYPQNIAEFPDQTIFSSDNEYPDIRAEILNSGNWGAIHIADLAVYPISYKSRSGRLLYYPEITVTFHLESDLGGEVVKRNDRFAYQALSRIAGNKGDLPILASPGYDDIPMLIGDIPSPEYLIITSGEIAPGFYPFLEWKNQKGVPTDMVLIEDILANYSGIDPPEQLRNYLMQAYNGGVRYVLLGGNEDVVPIRYLYPNNVNDRTVELHDQQISDLYYADLTGIWDVDGDGIWGESYNDSPDIYPELYVGRVPAWDADQAELWGAKAIMYEKNPGNGDPSYVTKALIICADQMRDLNQHQVLATMLPSNFSYDNSRLVEEPSGSSQTPTQPLASTVVDVMQEGWGFITNLNHGDFSWYASQASGYNQSNRSGVWGDTVLWDGCGALNHLTTFNQPSIQYSISCDLAAYDFDKDIFFPGPYISPYCYMESFMFQPGSGVAFLGNTRWGWVSASYNLEKKFFTRVFNDSTNTLAVAEALSKIDYPVHKDLCYGHNLFGDPEMKLWQSVDGFLGVAGPTEFGSGSPQSLTYTILRYNDANFGPDSTGIPVAGVKVCMYKAGELFDIEYTDSQGQADFNIIAQSDGYITVTATAADMIPGQLSVVVGSPLGFDDPTLPEKPTVAQNYPNPFNPSTTIEFALSAPGEVELNIYDITGRLVKNLAMGRYPAGKFDVTWNGDNENKQPVSSGVYFYKFESGATRLVKQMTLLK